jgi:hypothetical protein
MTAVARRVKPNWTGNSGIPPPPEEVEELEVVVDLVAGLVLVAKVVEELVVLEVELAYAMDTTFPIRQA